MPMFYASHDLEKEGGLTMVNIHNFKKSMKLGWMKKIVNQQSNITSLRYDILLSIVGNFEE